MKTWRGFFLFLIAFVLWAVGLIIVGQWGYDEAYCPSSEHLAQLGA